MIFSQFLKQADCPIVLVNRTLGIANTYDTITLDNIQGGYLATKHLLELGHRRIAMLRGPEISTTSQGRYEGYVYALQEAGIPLDKTLIRCGKTETSVIWTGALPKKINSSFMTIPLLPYLLEAISPVMD